MHSCQILQIVAYVIMQFFIMSCINHALINEIH
jgi:hypothetical protein